ncbi:hypothetical protein HPB49_017818 [Dermacentor silvarum]|uniref:Uncharacterized protein n=1 Tax=Dermacentor silvarum TaxID=543639 RepID=A0ACB8CAM7_DERSI|nr:uncharacterized protein LOC119462163 [Dermacentor silvarum]KAH7937942.1 hypothetical protein HPB49_017818 [Dermacentor silvarum]
MALQGSRKENFALPAEDRWPLRTLGEPKSRPPPEYPSQWFAAHPGSKPIAYVKRCFASEEDLARAVSAGLASGRLPVEYVVQFMHVEGTKIKDTLTEDWTSFGVTIGCAGEKISPWDLLTITEQSVPPGDLVDTVPAANDDNCSPDCTGLLAVVVCIYRLLVANCLGGTRDYIQHLQDNNLKRILQIFNSSGRYLEGAEKNFGQWIKDRSYLSLIAALDMFLYRFSSHNMAILRAGTKVSRNKHCTVRDDIARLCKETGLQPPELVEWVFIERAANELHVIFRKGQEMDVKYSYAPYLSDLGLCQRSPYSATANPLVHYWCNATIALKGSWAAQKSRITYDGDLSGVTINAVVLAYAKHTVSFGCLVASTLKEDEKIQKMLLAVQNAPREFRHMPKKFEAAQWYQYLWENSFIIDPKISKYCVSMLRTAEMEKGCGSRIGSVGAKLAELIPK